MKNKIIIITVIVTLIGVSLYVYTGRNSIELAVDKKQIEQQELSIEERFDQAKTLLIRHCATCIEKSRKGLLQGIHAMESVIQDGYTAVEAKSLLANAYNQMWVVYAKSSEEKKTWREKKRSFLVKALKAHPLNDDILTQYASTEESYPEKIKFYRKAVEINPENAYASFDLGVYLLEVGEVDQAANVFKEMVKFGELGALQMVGESSFYKLRDLGMDEEAKAILDLVNQRY